MITIRIKIYSVHLHHIPTSILSNHLLPLGDPFPLWRWCHSLTSRWRCLQRSGPRADDKNPKGGIICAGNCYFLTKTTGGNDEWGIWHTIRWFQIFGRFTLHSPLFFGKNIINFDETVGCKWVFHHHKVSSYITHQRKPDLNITHQKLIFGYLK